jgi:hypothetical protein
VRHCPELAGLVPRDASAFAPWRPIAATTAGSAEQAKGGDA